MTVSRLVVREILHRKGNFLLGVCLVGVSVACFMGAVAVLRAFDAQTDDMAAEMESKTKTEMAKLEDQLRKSMKGLGFNIFIFPEGQEMSEVYSTGFASKTMPEAYVDKLANSKIVKINHLLPQLTQKLLWPEQQRTVILIGVRGEVPIAHRDPKKPLIDPVPVGKIVLGYELHSSLGLSPGSEVKLLGKTMAVEKCHDQRGTQDDITIWMDLKEAQTLLDKEGLINSILALECNCASLDRLAEVRAELSGILPGTTIIESGSKALVRAEARNQAKATAESQLHEMKMRRAELNAGHEKFAAILVPVVALLGVAGIGALTWANTRQRRMEIGTLRALGVSSARVLAAFMGRAVIVGVAGVLLGVCLVHLGGAAFEEKWLNGATLNALVPAGEWIKTGAAALVLAAGAAWLPSLMAAQRDPAGILRHD